MALEFMHLVSLLDNVYKYVKVYLLIYGSLKHFVKMLSINLNFFRIGKKVIHQSEFIWVLYFLLLYKIAGADNSRPI